MLPFKTTAFNVFIYLGSSSVSKDRSFLATVTLHQWPAHTTGHSFSNLFLPSLKLFLPTGKKRHQLGYTFSQEIIKSYGKLSRACRNTANSPWPLLAADQVAEEQAVQIFRIHCKQFTLSVQAETTKGQCAGLSY